MGLGGVLFILGIAVLCAFGIMVYAGGQRVIDQANTMLDHVQHVDEFGIYHSEGVTYGDGE
jgi:hypothetical protein